MGGPFQKLDSVLEEEEDEDGEEGGDGDEDTVEEEEEEAVLSFPLRSANSNAILPIRMEAFEVICRVA